LLGSEVASKMIRGRTVDWLSLAECRFEDPELFLPKPGDNTALAMAVCACCVVQRLCLPYALSHPELTGIWGGTCGSDRARTRRAAG
jgi:WhiB family redox-sensing transcriptional regulator